jgi:hypothetical protein
VKPNIIFHGVSNDELGQDAIALSYLPFTLGNEVLTV